MAQKLKLNIEIIENIVGKGENAGYQQFILFATMFYDSFFQGL